MASLGSISFEGLLYRKFVDCKRNSAVVHQLVVPPALRNKVLEEVHKGIFGGYPSGGEDFSETEDYLLLARLLKFSENMV